MTSKSEGPGKGDRPPEGAPKRPHAMLDLKATEVKAEVRPAEGGPTPAARTVPDPHSSAATTAKEPASASAAASGDAQAARAKEGGASGAANGRGAPAPAGGKGRLGHLMSGIAGGILALLGAQVLSTSGFFGTAPIDARTRTLESKLAALEQSARAQAADPALAAKIDEAAARVSRLEGLAATVGQLSDAQARIEAETKSLATKAAEGVDPAAVTGRLDKLEEHIGALVAAAGTEADKGGRIAQAAAITGRISDLESKVENQFAALRKSIPDEIGNRLGTLAEASEAARTTSQRVDRDMQSVKTDIARVGQRTEALKADNERFGQALEAVKEEQGRQTSALDGLKTSFDQQLKSVVRTADIEAAVAPVSGKLAALEGNIESVVKSEQERKADAERIVVSLELANLKRAIESGAGFATELAAVRKSGGGKLDLTALDRYQNEGLPTLAALEAEFGKLAFAIIDAESAPAEAGVVDKLLAGAKSVVRVRKVEHGADDRSAEAVVARIEKALKDGRLADALTLAKDIPPKAAGLLSPWRTQAEARQAVDAAIGAVETQLKASLAGEASKAAAPPASSN